MEKLMEAANWNRCRDDFTFDGALIDILALDADEMAWESFLSAIKASPFTLACFRDNERVALPESSAWTFAEREFASICLSILVGKVTANCFFFVRSEIELDVDPREVTCQETFESMLTLMRFISNSTGLRVVATPEGGGQNCAFLSATPGGTVTLVSK